MLKFSSEVQTSSIWNTAVEMNLIKFQHFCKSIHDMNREKFWILGELAQDDPFAKLQLS